MHTSGSCLPLGHCRLGFVLLALGAALLWPPVTQGAWDHESAKAHFRNELAVFDRVQPAPPSCDPGFAASPNNYVIHTSEWAAEAGLRRGDKIESVAGASIASEEERWARLRLPNTGPLVLGISRGGQESTLSLPCRPAGAVWQAARDVLVNAANGCWTCCLGSLRRYVALRGFITSADIDVQLRCVAALNRVIEKPDTVTESKLIYEQSLLRIRESRYAPGTLDGMREGILDSAALLRKNGFVSWATDLEGQLRKGSTQGTAFVARPDGTLLTAFHLVRGAKDVKVTCPESPAMVATVESMAASNDIAVLKTAGSTPAYLSLAAPRSLRLGDPVFTIGFPATGILGTEPKFTEGSVSALSGPGGEATLIQMSVPVQPGNSGGALLNSAGEVVGIVTSTAAIQPFISATGALPQNINWAVKSAYASPLFDLPPRQPEAKSRTEAISRAMKATCRIEAGE